MLDNFRIAVNKQKKIILIFFLSIFIPSVFLGYFGVRAIKNERFKMARLIENEYRRSAGYLKTQIQNSCKEIGSYLENLSYVSFITEKDYLKIKKLLITQISEKPLIDLIFITYGDDEILLPQFQSLFRPNRSEVPQFKISQLNQLKRAEAYEFKLKRFERAYSLYQEIFKQVKDDNLRAQMLAKMARVQMKNKDYEKAIQNYMIIIQDYKYSLGSSQIPLAVISGLQIVSCYRETGDLENAMKSSLFLYRDILDMTWDLTEAQFRIYCLLISEAIEGIVSETEDKVLWEEFYQDWEKLKVLYSERSEQWRAMQDIKQVIIPELIKKFYSSSDFILSPFFYSATINDTPYLIVSIFLKAGKDSSFSGFLGAKLKQKYLSEKVLIPMIDQMEFSEKTDIVISDLTGRIITGKNNPLTEEPTFTDFFDENFPPWKIEFFVARTSGLGGMNIRKSFYFWTIIMLLIILTFGTVLIIRTIMHETGVLKIKSDFVSSVSHEFKTPLTSIKALVERLQSGKVQDKAKMSQYFSVLSQDTDRLIHLVGNILDFSKIEEGKREYDFRETNVAQLVSQKIQELQKDERLKGFSFKVDIQQDIPQISVDKEAFSQTLNNLLNNAIKFSSIKKEVSVHLGTDRENVILEVKDKGIGISPEDLDKIFDKFYQGKNARQQTVKGTGLGLTLVKHMVQAHGGRISVESKVGEGAQFTLIFPKTKK